MQENLIPLRTFKQNTYMERYVAMLRTDPDDQFFTESGMAEAGKTVIVRYMDHINDLFAEMEKANEPSLVLVNDRGTAHGGYEWLRQLKANPLTAHIPVVVLGEKSTEDYRRECYRAGANSFIMKPSSVSETRKKISLFFDYWSQVAEI